MIEHQQARHKINKILMRDGCTLDELSKRTVLGRGMRAQVHKMQMEAKE